MKKQRILSALLALCLVFSLAPTALAVNADDFTDVGRDSWCYEYVDYVTSKGYFLGTSDTTFSPDRNMTRAMFVVVLSRFDGAKVDNSQSAFTDVEPGSWCAGAINWAAANKIVEGKGDGKFAPNDPITRAQMCAIMDRYLNYYMNEEEVTLPEDGAVSSMTDRQQVPSYAVSAVKQCQRYGLINGYSDGTFRPQALSTRAHVAAVVYRMANLVKNAEAVKKPSSGGGSHSGSSTTKYYDLILDGVETSYKKGTEVTLPAGKNPPAGYEFDYWVDALGNKYYAGQKIVIRGNLALTPVWKAIPEDFFTLTLDGESASYVKGTEVTLPAGKNPPAGKKFSHWVDEEGNQYPEGKKITIDKNWTLTSVWVDVIHPNDLIGAAVNDTVMQVNGKYNNLKNDLLSAIKKLNDEKGYMPDQYSKVEKAVKDMVDIGTVVYGAEETGPRTVAATASVKVTEDLAVKVINKASDFAANLLDETSTNKPSASDVDNLVDDAVAIIEDLTGVTISGSDVEQIKADVIDKATEEGKELWSNFRNDDGYICGDVTIEAGVPGTDNYYKVTVDVDAANHSTTLVGVDKVEAVKKLAEVIAKDMFQQLKSQSTAANDYVDNTTMTGTVTVTFAPSDNKEYAEKTKSFPNVYKVSLDLTLNSNGLVGYKCADGEHYVIVNFTKDIEDAYNKAIQAIAADISKNDTQTKSKVTEKVTTELESKITSIVTGIKSEVGKYDITLDNTTDENVKKALIEDTNNKGQTAVEVWVDDNWDTIIGFVTGSNSVSDVALDGLENTALINALWDVVKVDLPTDESEMEDWIGHVVGSQTESFDLIGKVKENSTAVLLARMLGIDISTVEGINQLLPTTITLPTTGATINGEDLVYTMAKDEFDTRFQQSEAYKALYAQLSDETKDYLIYTALVKMGLNFDTKQEAKKDAALTQLLGIISDENLIKGKIDNKIKNELKKIDISDLLNEYINANKDYLAKINLVKSLQFPDVQTKAFENIAATLKGDLMQEIVGTRGDKTVAKYLDKYLNKLKALVPSSANVTINGVTLSEADLDRLSGDQTTQEVLNDLADVLSQFGALTLNDFATEQGIPVTVAYKTRTFDLNLVFSFAELATAE